MLLVGYRSPIAAVSLPRWINSQAELQSASPALETARLLRMAGVGIDVLKGFGAVLLLVAGLSVFIALYHAVRERENDLAMMRMLGAPPRRVATMVALEALWLAALGAILGLALGHGLTRCLLGLMLKSERSVSLSGTLCVDVGMVDPGAGAGVGPVEQHAPGVARLPARRHPPAAGAALSRGDESIDR